MTPTKERYEKMLVETVTKAILFEDCGNTADWEDNIDLGMAAIKAYRNAFGPDEWAELYRLREEIKGPDGYATWKDAAVAMRAELSNLKGKS